MKFNDRVMVSKRSLTTYGQEGTVKDVWPYGSKIDVVLDSGKFITIKEENLMLVKDKVKGSEVDSLYTVYVLFMHDNDQNPASLMEADNDGRFNFQEPACVSISIDSIKEVIEEDRDTWQNAYIVANNTIYPVNMAPECPGLF